MNIVFMGTPDFAVPTLEMIKKSGHNVSCVLTQPDKPKGRGNRMTISPVKEKALEYNLPILQPLKIKNDMDCIDSIKLYNPDVIVVVAFGQILPENVLSIPKYGCINVHASLLPKLRGAAPINWAVINGDEQTGITTMYMEKGLDTGDMLLKEAIHIGSDETYGEVHDRLKLLGASLLIKTLSLIESGEIKRVPQENSLSTYAPMLGKDTGRIEWSKKSVEIKNLVRGLNPSPGAYSFYGGNRLKIWKTDIHINSACTDRPGTVYKVDKEGIYVNTGDGGIIIKEIQPENGKRIDAYSYTLGHTVTKGSIFE